MALKFCSEKMAIQLCLICCNEWTIWQVKTEDSEVFVLIRTRLSAKCTFKSASSLISSALCPQEYWRVKCGSIMVTNNNLVWATVGLCHFSINLVHKWLQAICHVAGLKFIVACKKVVFHCLGSVHPEQKFLVAVSGKLSRIISAFFPAQPVSVLNITKTLSRHATYLLWGE